MMLINIESLPGAEPNADSGKPSALFDMQRQICKCWSVHATINMVPYSDRQHSLVYLKLDNGTVWLQGEDDRSTTSSHVSQ